MRRGEHVRPIVSARMVEKLSVATSPVLFCGAVAAAVPEHQAAISDQAGPEKRAAEPGPGRARAMGLIFLPLLCRNPDAGVQPKKLSYR